MSDFLVLVGLLLFLIQAGSVLLGRRGARWVVVLVCSASISAIAAFVWTRPPPGFGEGADIGGGVMVLLVFASVIVVGAAGLREAVEAARFERRRSRERRNTNRS